MAKPSSSDSSKPRKATSSDPRFASIQNDPRFRLPKKGQLKSDLDSRFKDAIKADKEFQKKVVVDKYGRLVENRDAQKELDKYYNIKGSEEDSDEEESDSESEQEVGSRASGTVLDRARGEGLSFSESESESESDSESDSDEFEEDEDFQLDERGSDSVPLGDETSAFACVNMDWDNIRAVDLMATFASFAPKNGHILSVSIYPSEYGKKMMAQEEFNGPAAELFQERNGKKEKEEEINEKTIIKEDIGEEVDSKKFRKYQLQRLQYYYAVVKCDSIRTAKAIYENCEGTEFESTANFFDLRYVPDNMEFEDKPKESCDKLPGNFKPNTFVTDALQHSKVKLTWDETPAERRQMASKVFSQKEIDDMDYKAYLASDSESENENEEDRVNKYKLLLGDYGSKAKEEEEDVDMEITFTPGLDEAAKEDNKQDEDETTIAKYKRKEKERRKRRMEGMKNSKDSTENSSSTARSAKEDRERKQAEIELLLMDDDIASKHGKKLGERQQSETNSTKKTGNERKKTKSRERRDRLEEAEADFDVGDSRFQALFDNPEFAIDTTLPQFKKTKGMEKILNERRKRTQDGSTNVPSERSKNKNKKRKSENETTDTGVSINSLVEKIKRRKQGTR